MREKFGFIFDLIFIYLIAFYFRLAFLLFLLGFLFAHKVAWHSIFIAKSLVLLAR